MEYMLLIHSAADAAEAADDEERQAMFAAFGKYTERLREAGALVAGDPLQPAHTATTVRSSGGETLTTDGPYAETKEVLGGYYKIEVDSLDEAIEWASQIPSLPRGDAVEVWPVMPVPSGRPG
jgi:hypothetical protein